MSALNWIVKRLLDPAALLWLALIVYAIIQCRRKRYIEASFSTIVALLLSAFGGTTLTEQLVRTLEEPYYLGLSEEIAVSDVVLVLGGHASSAEGEPHGFDAGAAFDRVLTGIELVRSGKGGRLFLGGGAAGSSQPLVPEFDLINPWIERWELLDLPVGHLGLCRNTREEALKARKMADEQGWGRVILVTSALHMRRAEAVFEKTGLDVAPIACDFRSKPTGPNVLIPSSGRLYLLRAYLHEIVGVFSYRIRGWID